MDESSETEDGKSGPAAAANRVEELARLLAAHRRDYYEGRPRISDAAFDALEEELRDLAPDHPALAEVGAPPAPVSEWEKARHLLPMGSLNKVTSEAELREWAARCDALAAEQGLANATGTLFVTEKLDGLSLELVYEEGLLVDGISRGDGEVGERITPNVRRMKGALARLPEPLSLSVRGEIILQLTDWRAAFEGTANPRNAAAGTSKRLDGKGCERLTVLCYDVEGPELATEQAKMALLVRLGFLVPAHVVTDVAGALRLHGEYVAGRRAALDYDIDGLVVRVDDLAAEGALGELHRRPRGAVAFKFPSPAKVSRVREIAWETGPSGRVVPVALVEPVVLAGATVRRASLHNAARVLRLGIGPGDEVLVSRRNDVIPYVEEVVTSGGTPAAAPERCGVCDAELVRDGEYLHCRNRDCPAVVEGRIASWVGALGLIDWGDKLIAQLVRERAVRQPADLYRLTPGDVASLERRGEKSARKILDALAARKAIPLSILVAGLGIEGFSLQTARLLVKNGFATLEQLFAATVEELAALAGLGEIRARAIRTGLDDKRPVVAALLAIGVEPTGETIAGPLGGKSFCFTGEMKRSRAALHALVESHGGLVKTSVTKGLDYLVLADPAATSSKADKARRLGIRCIGEDELLALLAV